MEQIVKVITTVSVEMYVHGTEPIVDDEMIARIKAAMFAEAAQFIVCAEHPPGQYPVWVAGVDRMDVSIDRVRTVDIDLT